MGERVNDLQDVQLALCCAVRRVTSPSPSPSSTPHYITSRIRIIGYSRCTAHTSHITYYPNGTYWLYPDSVVMLYRVVLFLVLMSDYCIAFVALHWRPSNLQLVRHSPLYMLHTLHGLMPYQLRHSTTLHLISSSVTLYSCGVHTTSLVIILLHTSHHITSSRFSTLHYRYYPSQPQDSRISQAKTSICLSYPANTSSRSCINESTRVTTPWRLLYPVLRSSGRWS